MADTSAYPGALDGDLKAVATAHVTAPPGGIDFLELLADAVAKIETELGTNPSGAAATVAAAIAALAPLASPAFTGTPTAPTAAGGTNSTQLATTAFVAAAQAALVDSSPAALDTLNELAAALGDDPNFATTVTNALAAKLDTATAASTYAALGADLADFTSGAAPDGQVPTADGLGGVSWEAPSGGGGSVSDTAYGVGWDGDTTVAPSKNAVYDKVETLAPLASPTFTGLPVGPQWQSSGVAGANTTPLTISGANASGAPATGAHVKGEIAGDDTGKLWYCTVAGTPGTWVNVGAAGGGSVATDAIFDAKGDLPVGTAADTAARLAVGTNGQVLVADSAQTTGVKWATFKTVSAAATLTNHIPNNLTYEQWATEVATVAQADAPPSAVVLAWLSGEMLRAITGSIGDRGQVQMEVSFDGGSTWADIGGDAAPPIHSTSTFLAVPFTCTGRATGTVTGDIQVRAKVRDVDTVNSTNWSRGRILVEVHPQ